MSILPTAHIRYRADFAKNLHRDEFFQSKYNQCAIDVFDVLGDDHDLLLMMGLKIPLADRTVHTNYMAGVLRSLPHEFCRDAIEPLFEKQQCVFQVARCVVHTYIVSEHAACMNDVLELLLDYEVNMVFVAHTIGNTYLLKGLLTRTWARRRFLDTWAHTMVEDWSFTQNVEQWDLYFSAGREVGCLVVECWELLAAAVLVVPLSALSLRLITETIVPLARHMYWKSSTIAAVERPAARIMKRVVCSIFKVDQVRSPLDMFVSLRARVQDDRDCRQHYKKLVQPHFIRLDFVRALARQPRWVLSGRVCEIARLVIRKYIPIGHQQQLCAKLFRGALVQVRRAEYKIPHSIGYLFSLLAELLKRISAREVTGNERYDMQRLMRLAQHSTCVLTRRAVDLVTSELRLGERVTRRGTKTRVADGRADEMCCGSALFEQARRTLRQATEKLSRLRGTVIVAPAELATRHAKYARRTINSSGPKQNDGRELRLQRAAACPHRVVVQDSTNCYLACACNLLLGNPFTQLLVAHLVASFKDAAPAVFDVICTDAIGYDHHLPWSLQVLRYLQPRVGLVWTEPCRATDSLQVLERQYQYRQKGSPSGGSPTVALAYTLECLGLRVHSCAPLSTHEVKVDADVLICHNDTAKVRAGWVLIGAMFLAISDKVGHVIAGTRWDCEKINMMFLVDSAIADCEPPDIKDWLNASRASIIKWMERTASMVGAALTPSYVWLSCSACARIVSDDAVFFTGLRKAVLNA